MVDVVKDADGTWSVVSEGITIATGLTHAQAWIRADRINDDPISPSEKRQAWSQDQHLKGKN